VSAPPSPITRPVRACATRVTPSAAAVAPSHEATTLGRNPSPWAALLREELAGTVTVEPNGRSAHEDRWRRGALRRSRARGSRSTARATAGSVACIDRSTATARAMRPTGSRRRRPPSSASTGRIPAAGSQLTSSAPLAGRRTSRRTTCPSARSCCTSSVPMNPDAPPMSTVRGRVVSGWVMGRAYPAGPCSLRGSVDSTSCRVTSRCRAPRHSSDG
jgi:hypothetical protein